MNNNTLLIILTENSWLYFGLATLLQEMECVMLRFNDCLLPDNVRNADRVLVAVDSLILFSGEWKCFNNLRSSRADAKIYWLTRGVTGFALPAGNDNYIVLNQNQNLRVLRNAFRGMIGATEGVRRVMPINLTPTERFLLCSFCSGISIKSLSSITGKSVKTLYSQRHSILLKKGFRQASFLLFIYKKNYNSLST